MCAVSLGLIARWASSSPDPTPAVANDAERGAPHATEEGVAERRWRHPVPLSEELSREPNEAHHSHDDSGSREMERYLRPSRRVIAIAISLSLKESEGLQSKLDDLLRTPPDPADVEATYKHVLAELELRLSLQLREHARKALMDGQAAAVTTEVGVPRDLEMSLPYSLSMQWGVPMGEEGATGIQPLLRDRIPALDVLIEAKAEVFLSLAHLLVSEFNRLPAKDRAKRFATGAFKYDDSVRPEVRSLIAEDPESWMLWVRK